MPLKVESVELLKKYFSGVTTRANHHAPPTPHKQPYKYNLNPVTGASNFSRAGKLAYPMGWGDMMRVIWHLMK